MTTAVRSAPSPAQADMAAIVQGVLESDAYRNEIRYVGRGGYEVARTPRLFKHLEHDLVRVVFPTDATIVTEGTIVAMVNLWDKRERHNIYCHTICAGPGVNTLLRALHTPMPVALPQPGKAGEAAIAQFVAWKQAAWVRFLNDELELGAPEASAIWIRNFWRALDRMFGGNVLLNYP